MMSMSFRIWFDWILLNGRGDGNLLLHLLRGTLGPQENFFQLSLLFFSVIDWDQGAVSASFLGFLKFL